MGLNTPLEWGVAPGVRQDVRSGGAAGKAIHRAGKADAEWLYRIRQQPHAPSFWHHLRSVGIDPDDDRILHAFRYP